MYQIPLYLRNLSAVPEKNALDFANLFANKFLLNKR